MMYDIILLENLGFPSVSRKREVGVFKNLHSGKRFLKRCVFSDRFHRIRVDGRPNQRKNLCFQTKRDTCGRGLDMTVWVSV